MEAETLGGTRSDAQALVYTLADTLAEVQVVALGVTLGHTEELIDTLADSLAEVRPRH